jgi:hypothetical protein
VPAQAVTKLSVAAFLNLAKALEFVSFAALVLFAPRRLPSAKQRQAIILREKFFS